MKAFILLAGAAIAFATPAAAQNIVNNGSFETGNFAGFTQFGNTGFTGVQTMGESPIAPTDGIYFAFFGPVGDVGGISQSLATTAGQGYAISFDLQNDGGAPASFAAMFGSTSLFNLVNSPASGFTTYSTTAIANSASTNLSFSFRHDPAFYRLDNVSVTALGGAVPEPATWAMMLVGFGMVGTGMRRRNGQQLALSRA